MIYDVLISEKLTYWGSELSLNDKHTKVKWLILSDFYQLFIQESFISPIFF